MDQRKVLRIDIDDTILDLLKPWLEWYNEKYADSLQRHHITDWDLTKFVKPECGRDIYEFLHLPDMYDRVEPLSDALKGIQELRAMNYRVTFLTAANIYQMGPKLSWLGRHGFLELLHGTTSPDYIVAHDKSAVNGFGLVDDGLHNIEVTPAEHKILFTSSHNIGCANKVGFYRADNWNEVVKYFDFYKSKNTHAS